jgi:outer membrane protein insertion porin family
MGSVCTNQTSIVATWMVIVLASLSGCQGGPYGGTQTSFSPAAHVVAPQGAPSAAAASSDGTSLDEPTTIRGQSPDRIRNGAASGPELANRGRNNNAPTAPVRGILAAPTVEKVIEVRVTGNRVVPVAKIMQSLHTRVGRFYDPDVVASDVRRLWATRQFIQVKPLKEQVPGGVIVTFEVGERATVRYVKFVGNEKLHIDRLERKVNIKIGAPLDSHAVKRGKVGIEEIYQKNGFFKARVDVVEGLKRYDLGVVYKINEGPAPKIRWISFVGNELATDARLRSVIKTKMPILWAWKGWLDYESIDRDVQLLTNYYKDLGYFRARVGREIDYSGEGGWASVKFVIDEGPRYRVRSVSFRGNDRFNAAQLAQGLELNVGDEFSKVRMTKDRSKVVDQYGALGYIEADIEAEPRLLEEQPELDLVYHIREGAVYRVARINVHIEGDDPHTKITTALNRIALRPGEIVDTRKLRASQRRLRAAGIFASNPAQGSVPRISYNLRTSPPVGLAFTDLAPNRRVVTNPLPNVRGQSPNESAAESIFWPTGSTHSAEHREPQEGTR